MPGSGSTTSGPRFVGTAPVGTAPVATDGLGPTTTVTLSAPGSTLEVATTGATPLTWWLDLPGGRFDVLDGYRDAEELAEQDGVRNGIMAPFCNRVKDARYTFDGVAHDLRPGALDRTVYHGLVRSLPFRVVDARTSDDGADVTLRCTALCDTPAVGYPFAVSVDVAYRLRTCSLEVIVTGTNHGSSAAPFAAGWHPYFRLPGSPTIDRLHLSVPTSRRIRTDADLIPLPGAAALDAPTAEGLGAGETRWTPLGQEVLDAAFGPLGADDGGGGGGARCTVLSDPVSGVRLVLSQDRGLVHVFTGDTLGRDRRRSVAVEPVETLTDAFNRPDCADEIRLEAGARRSFSFAVAVEVS